MILYTLIAAITIVLGCLVNNTTQNEYEHIGAGDDKASKALFRLPVGYTTRQKAINALCLISVFIVLTSLASLRHEVGNDYGTYVVTCHEIFQKGYVVTEPGFNLVVRILYTLSGKEDYLLMFGVFGAAIVAIFLKVLVDQSASFAWGFFVFMTMGFYYRSFILCIFRLQEM